MKSKVFEKWIRNTNKTNNSVALNFLGWDLAGFVQLNCKTMNEHTTDTILAALGNKPCSVHTLEQISVLNEQLLQSILPAVLEALIVLSLSVCS